MRAADARLLDGSALLPAEAIEAFRAHAIEDYPNEALGYVDATGVYRRLQNVSPDPRRYAVAPRGTLPRLLAARAIRTLCHSHPDGIDAPTEPDMRSQIEAAIPYVLCATNGQATTDPFAWGDQLIDDEPLVGRLFRHGVSDCYGLIRSYFRQTFDVVLPEYPRNWEWWIERTGGEKDLYRRFFGDAGFRLIDRSEARPGDCWIAAVRGNVPNHAGVLLDSGLCLHHASGGRAYDPNRLSRREPMARWLPYVTHWCRRSTAAP